MTRIEQIRQALSERPDVGRTHWDGCEVDPQHRDCAIRHLLSAWDTRDAALRTLVARFQIAGDDDLNDYAVGYAVCADALDAILKETTHD